ncbi:MAG: hypothetical protein MI806_07465 [Minwuiales bacterium]|nr:hypothetical protein [Minwuiales bacterium]
MQRIVTAAATRDDRHGRDLYLAMPKQPDNADLAKRFVDLWQEQTALMAADPRFAEAIGHVVGRLSPDLNAGRGPREDEQDDRGSGSVRERDGEPAKAAGTAPDGAASDLGNDVAGELARRIAECEARIAALASEPGGGGGKPDD